MCLRRLTITGKQSVNAVVLRIIDPIEYSRPSLYGTSLYGNQRKNLAIWKGLRSPDWAFYIVLALAIWKSIPKPRYMEQIFNPRGLPYSEVRL